MRGMAKAHPTDMAEIGRRIEATRKALGKTPSEFARLTGLSPQNIHQFEIGMKRPSVDSALKICAATGVTLDWVYRGLATGLPTTIAERMFGPPSTSARQNDTPA